MVKIYLANGKPNLQRGVGGTIVPVVLPSYDIHYIQCIAEGGICQVIRGLFVEKISGFYSYWTLIFWPLKSRRDFLLNFQKFNGTGILPEPLGASRM